MQPTDEKDSGVPRSENSPTQHMFESSVPLQTDQLISGDNEKVYAFHHSHKHLSLKQRFGLLSRTRQVLLVVGSVSVVFIVSMVVLTFVMYEPPRKSSTTLATKSSAVTEDLNNDGVVDTEDAKVAAGDANKDGVVDDKDLAFVEADLNSDGVVDEADTIEVTDEDIAWWQELIGKIKGVEEDSGGTGDEYSNSETGVAYEDETDPDATADETEYAEAEVAYDYAENEDIAEEENLDVIAPTVEDTVEPEPTPLPSEPTVSSTFTIASWNTLYTNSASNVVSGTSAIAKKAQIIGFQELNFANRRKAIRDKFLCSSCAYAGYIPNYTENGWATKSTVSIIWNKKRFKALDKGTFSVLGPNAYGANTSSKWINWVKLKDAKTGKDFYVLNTHFTAGATSKGKPSSQGGAVKNYTHHVNDLVGQIKKFKSSGNPVFIAGDFNINYQYDKKVRYKDFPYVKLGALGARSNWDRLNVKGTNAIDYVWSNNNDNVKAEAASRASSSYGSDHKPVFYSVRLSK